MRAERFEWGDPRELAMEIRSWPAAEAHIVLLDEIESAVMDRRDAAVLELTGRYDATERPPTELRVDPGEPEAALRGLDAELREALEIAAANIRAVAEAQVEAEPRLVKLAQGHSVEVREVPIEAAGIYVPGGRAAYPSTVLMCCVPAAVAGVERLALASPPGPDGRLPSVVLAAAALCGVSEVYAMGGPQAIFALAHGTESVKPVDLIAGPGNRIVQDAKRRVFGLVGIDSLAGPSELMVIAGHDTNVEWAALDLCAQAEHGVDSPLLVAATEDAVLDAIERATKSEAESRHSVSEAGMALVQVPDLADAVALANAFAPEHLQIMSEDAYALAPHVRTAGCVFVGATAATAFGDYAAGSNHVLPTGGAGRFSGPLGPGTFRRRIANVTLPGRAAEALAPHVDALAGAEGFPVHGESARARGSMR
jgi:histidinol dehydrogenase